MTINFDALATLEPIAMDELKKLHTGSLLTRLKRLRRLQESFDLSDWTQEESDAVSVAGLIAFKDSDIWRSAFADVKNLLAEREHIPRGSQKKKR